MVKRKYLDDTVDKDQPTNAIANNERHTRRRGNEEESENRMNEQSGQETYNGNASALKTILWGLTYFQGSVGPGKKRSKLANRSPEKQIPRLIEGYRRRLMNLERRIPTFKAKVTLQYLEKHAGSMEELARLQPVLEDMQKPGFPIISTSTRIVCPETGETIMAYLAETPKTWVTNKMGYTFADSNDMIGTFTELKEHGDDMINDGFPADLVEQYYESVHFMAAMNNPGADQTAARHGVDAKKGKSLHRFPLRDGVAWTCDPKEAKVMRTNIPEPGLVYSENNGKEGTELAGVHHFVEGWEQRGHHGKGLFQSKDMIHTSSASTSVAHYYHANDLLERHISTIIEVFFPRDHAVLAPAREAARIMDTSGGCVGNIERLYLHMHATS
ncbi:hypothetical protein VNI00_017941 [Paramarasmius palmivorus]|uniref:Uncharacterized protein n=1 Tax=Paramarasmius palmivorus TaxID=297713 RepID=A0AAW0B1H1_9AGAR